MNFFFQRFHRQGNRAKTLEPPARFFCDELEIVSFVMTGADILTAFGKEELGGTI